MLYCHLPESYDKIRAVHLQWQRVLSSCALYSHAWQPRICMEKKLWIRQGRNSFPNLRLIKMTGKNLTTTFIGSPANPCSSMLPLCWTSVLLVSPKTAFAKPIDFSVILNVIPELLPLTSNVSFNFSFF